MDIESNHKAAYYKDNMISYLKGNILAKTKESVIIVGVQGIGYEVFLPHSVLGNVSEGEEVELFCHLEAGEKDLRLYGFFSLEQLELFKILRGISGVGPKAALEICGLDSPEHIKEEIQKGNEKILEKIPGVGRKKARKIILELSGKLKLFGEDPRKKRECQEDDEVVIALANLGFSKKQAKSVLTQLPPETKDVQERIKLALKILGRK